MSHEIDTIARCPQCHKLVGVRWYAGSVRQKPGWRLYQHADAQGEPYCEGGGLIQ